MSTNEAFSHDRYLVDQLIRPIANLYRITPLAAGETPLGGPVAFVRQKKMAIKEDIRFFADESETNELFRLKARSVLDTGGSRYDVTDAQGTPVGVLHHLFRQSLFRSTCEQTLDWARSQRYVPAREDDVPVEAEVTKPVRFYLY